MSTYIYMRIDRYMISLAPMKFQPNMQKLGVLPRLILPGGKKYRSTPAFKEQMFYQ